MKKIYLLIAIICFLLSTAIYVHALEVLLVVTPSPDERAVGHMIYWRNSSGDIGYMNLKGSTEYNISNIAPDTYDFYATAYDIEGNESGPCSTITYTKDQDKIPTGEDVPPPTEIEANFNLNINEVE